MRNIFMKLTLTDIKSKQDLKRIFINCKLFLTSFLVWIV